MTLDELKLIESVILGDTISINHIIKAKEIIQREIKLKELETHDGIMGKK